MRNRFWLATIIGVILASLGIAGADPAGVVVRITSPGGGSAVEGVVPVEVAVKKDFSGTLVELFADGAKVGETTLKSGETASEDLFSLAWDASGEAPATSHILEAKATSGLDSALTLTARVAVKTVGAKIGRIGSTDIPSSSPINVSGTVPVRVDVATPKVVSLVELFVAGEKVGELAPTAAAASYTVNWDTRRSTPGVGRNVTAVATLGGSSTLETAAVAVTVLGARVLSPASGAVVSGVVPVAVEAYALAPGVKSVDLIVDGDVVASDTAAPFEFAWDSSSFSSVTKVSLSARANGNTQYEQVATSGVAAIDPLLRQDRTVNYISLPNVVVLNGVVIVAPTSGPASGVVEVAADAADADGVSQVEFFVDGVSAGGADATAPYTLSWDTTAESPGSHVLTAVATDSLGNTTTSDAVVVLVDNDAPTASFTTEHGAVLKNLPMGSDALEGTAGDAGSGLATIGVVLNHVSLNLADSGTASIAANGTWTYTPPFALVPGDYTVTVTATDRASNKSVSATIQITIV